MKIAEKLSTIQIIRYSLDVKIFTEGITHNSRTSPKPGESGDKEFTITSSGKSHNSSCTYYKTTKSARYSIHPSRNNCKICGDG